MSLIRPANDGDAADWVVQGVRNDYSVACVVPDVFLPCVHVR